MKKQWLARRLVWHQINKYTATFGGELHILQERIKVETNNYQALKSGHLKWEGNLQIHVVQQGKTFPDGNKTEQNINFVGVVED